MLRPGLGPGSVRPTISMEGGVDAFVSGRIWWVMTIYRHETIT